MTTASPEIRTFFDQYARSRTALDIDLIGSQYAESIMFAGPNGTQLSEKTAVIAAFPRGREFLKTAGYKSTDVVAIDETQLAPQYVLARVQFLWRFEKTPAPPIEVPVDSTFVLFLNNGALTIVFQHEREDFQQALRAHGVLPAKP